MGFTRPSKVYRLVFEDPQYEGLEVSAKSVPLGRFLELTALAESASESLTAEDLRNLDGLFAGFAEALVSWNLDAEDGTPIPANLDGIRGQDVSFMFDIVTSWMTALAGVAGPLDGRSTSGETFPEESLPMEPSSESRAS